MGCQVYDTESMTADQNWATCSDPYTFKISFADFEKSSRHKRQ